MFVALSMILQTLNERGMDFHLHSSQLYG